MSSSGGKRSTGQRFTKLLKGVKSGFRRPKTVSALIRSAPSSSGPDVAVAMVAQQEDMPVSELERLEDDYVVHQSPTSTSDALRTGTEEAELEIRTEIDAVDPHEFSVETSGNALMTDAQQSTPAEQTETYGIKEDTESSDTVRTLERYKKAVERIKKVLELRRESWASFELSSFDSLPLGDEHDIANLQLQIDKVLESRMNSTKNRTKWGKSKHILELCFKALAPFTKNVLSVGMNAAQVPSTPEISEVMSRSLFSIHKDFWLVVSFCSSRYISGPCQAMLILGLGT
jgi:hypothetical protein